MTTRQRLCAISMLVLVLFASAGCKNFSSPEDTGPLAPDSGKNDTGDLLGAGASFPSVIYQGWFYEYHRVAPGVRVNYQSIGSGAGIQQFIEGTIDFGATDAPMSDTDLAEAPLALHLPTVLGAVVLAYNLPELDQPLNLDAEVTAGIFLGTIPTWNDPAIAALNPGVTLPSRSISTVHRSDSSGTTYVFTDWLNEATDTWDVVGKSKSPNWPSGIGGQGNEGVAALLANTPGAIGYVELNYLERIGLPGALLKNGAGEFVGPSVESVSAAAEGIDLPDDFRISLVNSDQPGAYPAASFTYLLISREQDECDKARVLLHLLWWIYHEPAAADLAAELDYAPLPRDVIERVDQALLSVTCDGSQVLHEASQGGD